MEPKNQYKNGKIIEPWQPGYELIEGENFESLVERRMNLNDLYASGNLVRLENEIEQELLVLENLLPVDLTPTEDELVDLLLRPYSPCPSAPAA